MLEDMIRDWLVCGMNDSKIQERLLVEPRLILTKAAQMAQSMELAEKDAADISTARSTVPQDPRTSESVNKVSTSNRH